MGSQSRSWLPRRKRVQKRREEVSDEGNRGHSHNLYQDTESSQPHSWKSHSPFAFALYFAITCRLWDIAAIWACFIVPMKEEEKTEELGTSFALLCVGEMKLPSRH